MATNDTYLVDNVEDSPGKSTFEVLFILLKCTLIMVLLSFGFLSYKSEASHQPEITKLFMYYIVVVLVFMFYEFFWEHIGFLFYVMWASQFGQLIQFHLLMQQVNHHIDDVTVLWMKR